MRLVAYAQFLESYKSVTMESMATAFDVGLPFLDEEISGFICAGRLSAKIDKVAGIIETRRWVVQAFFALLALAWADVPCICPVLA